MFKSLFAILLAVSVIAPVAAQEDVEPSPALEQLRHVVGDWDVSTTFFKPDGTVGSTFEGSYSFSWVMEDRIIQGVSTIPAFEQSSGILFYLRPSTHEIEMTSVGAEGQLWVMTGADDSEIRETANVAMPDGSTLKLRFTRYNVMPDSFESRMDASSDGGETWRQGNHQMFARQKAE